jgi:hypothetical protein
MKPILYPYRIGSQSARALADSLKTKCVRRNGNYKYFSSHLIINWGASQSPVWNRAGIKVLNHWSKVHISHNKLTALNKMRDNNVNTIEFTTNINDAKNWIKEKKHCYVPDSINKSLRFRHCGV